MVINKYTLPRRPLINLKGLATCSPIPLATSSMLGSFGKDVPKKDGAGATVVFLIDGTTVMAFFIDGAFEGRLL